MASLRQARVATLVCFFLTAFFSAYGQTPVPDRSPANPATPAEASQIAQQYSAERLALWQRRLKLEDWRISVQQARSTQLKPGTLGAISWDKSRKTAVIWVLDAADYQLPFRQMLDDMELTVVHELIHLELASLPKGQASRSSEEHAVNGFADALLALDRGKQ